MRILSVILFIFCFCPYALHAQELQYKLGGTQKEDGQSSIKIFTLDPKKYRDEPRRLFFEKIDIEKPFLKVGNFFIDIKKLSTLDTNQKAITLAAFNNTDTPVILLQDAFLILQVEIQESTGVWRPLNYHYGPECLVNKHYQLQPRQLAIIRTKSLNGSVKTTKRIKIATCPLGVISTSEFESSYDTNTMYIPQSRKGENLLNIETAAKVVGGDCDAERLRVRNNYR